MSLTVKLGRNMKVVNKKSGKQYTIINDSVINGTNANDGQVMILYAGEMKDSQTIGLFVREKKEFFEKFEIYEF